jgi:hypothetical protein
MPFNFFKCKLLFNAKNITLFVLFFGATNFSFSQKLISKEEFNKDLNFLFQKLEKHHLGYDYYLSAEELNKEKDILINSLPDSLDQRTAFLKTSYLISLLKDLHTSVLLPKELSQKNEKVLPFVLRKFEDRFFIHYNVSNDSTLIRTSEVISIDSEKVYTIYQNLKNLYGTDNGNDISKEYYAERAFYRYYYLLEGNKDSVLIAFKINDDSLAVSKKIATVASKDFSKLLVSKYKNATRKNMNFVVLDSSAKIAKLDITRFMHKYNVFDVNQLKFKKDLKKAFKQASNEKIENLIIDLRANGGGYIPNVGRLISYLSPEKFNLIDSMTFKKESYFKIFPIYSLFPPVVAPILFSRNKNKDFILRNSFKKSIKPKRKYRFDGQVFVLMDGGSYSATTFTIGLLKSLNRATFIGTRPAGANWGSFAGTWTTATLPFSKVKARIPLYKIVHAQKNQSNASFFVEPDFYVEQNFEDFKIRKDTQIEFTIELIKNKINK